jgi:hypothetical protein
MTSVLLVSETPSNPMVRQLIDPHISDGPSNVHLPESTHFGTVEMMAAIMPTTAGSLTAFAGLTKCLREQFRLPQVAGDLPKKARI